MAEGLVRGVYNWRSHDPVRFQAGKDACFDWGHPATPGRIHKFHSPLCFKKISIHQSAVSTQLKLRIAHFVLYNCESVVFIQIINSVLFSLLEKKSRDRRKVEI